MPGAKSPTAWRTSLEQHPILYRALERRLDGFLVSHPAWAAAFAEPFRRRVPDFEADLDALGVDPETRTGFRNLDPYGHLQPARWASFKTGLDATSFTDADRDQIRAGANAMFGWVGKVADDVWAATDVAPGG